ncbi:MAG: sensor histidine kinase [Candidatus Limnocylindrales bacterium]
MTTDPETHPSVRDAAPDPPEIEEAPLLRRTRWRLIAWSGGLTLLILALLGVLVYGAVARSLDSSATAQLERRAEQIAGFIEHTGAFPQRPQVGIAFGGDASGTIAFIIGPGGAVQGGANSGLPSGLPDAGGVAASRQAGSDVRDSAVAGIPVRIYSLAVKGPDGTYVVQVVGDQTAEQRLLSTLLIVLVSGGLAAVLLAIAAGYVYSGRALVPIRESIRRRQEALRRQREFTANASHELRTPLTVVRASVADLRRNRSRPVAEVGNALEDIEAEVDHLTALVDDLLLLARTDSGAVQIEHVPVDLADVAAEATGALASVATERGVHLEVDPRPAELLGDPLRLRQLVTILVDNALAHTPAGGGIVVRVRHDQRAAVLEVMDEGPGIREADLDHVFERFWRADDAPSGGTGLGLSIARWIVERHGGTIRAANRPEGGARFEARIPVAEAAAPSGGLGGAATPAPPPADAGDGAATRALQQVDAADPGAGEAHSSPAD